MRVCILLASTLVIGLAIAAPQVALADTAGLADPYDVLRTLRDAHNWWPTKSMWDGHVGRPRPEWFWTLKIEYGVTPSGRLTGCNVVRPSGSNEFDLAACDALVRKARVAPAVNGAGKAVRSSGEMEFKLRYSSGLWCATGMDEEDDAPAPAPPPK
jgi:TonB family protein